MSSEEKKPRKPRAPRKSEIVSPASAPTNEKDDRQTRTDGKDVATDPSLQPDSFPPHTTDSSKTDSTKGIDADSTVGKDSGAEIISSASNSKSKADSHTDRQGSETTTTQTSQPDSGKNTGNVRSSPAGNGSIRDSEVLESLPIACARDGETKKQCWERLRRECRAAGMTRRGAIAYAGAEVERLFPPAPIPEPIPEKTPQVEPDNLLPIGNISETQTQQNVDVLPADTGIPASVSVEPDVPGLGSIPESWGSLSANAPLQVEIAWVSANRLVVRSGKGVDLSRALSPAPSYSALSWLETAILFPSKFADISVKATAQEDSEKELVKREKMAIEEIRSLLKEMLEPK